MTATTPPTGDLSRVITDTIDKLTASRESIRRATKLFMDNISQAQQIFPILVSRISKVTMKQKLAILYLIDSICQSSHMKLNETGKDALIEAYLNQTYHSMNQIIKLVCPSPTTSSPLPQQHCESVSKVLSLWITRRMFPTEIVQCAAKVANLSLDLSNQSSKRSTPDSGRKEHQREKELKTEGRSHSKTTPPTPSSHSSSSSLQNKLIEGRRLTFNESQITKEALTQPVVYIWDLDEVLLLLNPLINGQFAERMKKDIGTCMELGERLEKLVYNFADQHMFFKDIELVDQHHIDAVSNEDDGTDLRNYNFKDNLSGNIDTPENRKKLAYRYRIIKNLYQKISLDYLLSEEEFKDFKSAKNDADLYMGGWLDIAIQLIKSTQKDKYATNIIVSSGQLVLAFAKCLLFDLSQLISVDCIFSSQNLGRQSILETIVKKYGRAVYYCFGTGIETEKACVEIGIPFLKVKTHTDMKQLQKQFEKIREWREIN